MSDAYDDHFERIRERERLKQMEWLRDQLQNYKPDPELIRQLVAPR